MTLTAQVARNYTEVSDCLAAQVPFRHRSISAHHDAQGTYNVLSYSTVVATRAADGTTWLTSNRYSVTTSKHMSYIRRAWCIKASA